MVARERARQGYYPSADFAFTRTLEANWERILAEYRAVRAHCVDYVERGLYNQGWEVFIMKNFPHREPVLGHAEMCPFTARLVQEHVPRLGVLCFSVMDSGTVIAPHEGYGGDYLRCHLGLDVPPGDCAAEQRRAFQPEAGRPRAWRRAHSSLVHKSCTQTRAVFHRPYLCRTIIKRCLKERSNPVNIQ